MTFAYTSVADVHLLYHFAFRETLLGQLSVYIRQLRDDFMQKTSSSGGGVPKGKNLPDTVNNIVWVRQLEAKVCIFLLKCGMLSCDTHTHTHTHTYIHT